MDDSSSVSRHKDLPGWIEVRDRPSLRGWALVMLRVERHTTVGAFLDDMEQRFGDARGLRTYVRSHPQDLAAKTDLEDVEFFRRHPEMRSEPLDQCVSLIPVSGRALSVFTVQRMALLDALAAGRYGSTRALARHLARDVRNVHGDLRVLHGLGIVEFERGPGRRQAPRLAGGSMRIELGPPGRRHLAERQRRVLAAEESVSLDRT